MQDRFFHPSAPPPYAPGGYLDEKLMPSYQEAYYPPVVPRAVSATEAPPELGDDFNAGKRELKEQGLSKQKARMCILLDVSRSMQSKENKFFLDDAGASKVQKLINRVLALAFSMDDNHEIDIIPFGDEAYPVDDSKPIITLNRKNYKNAIEIVMDKIKDPLDKEPKPNIFYHLKDDTNYAAALRKLRKHYFNDVGPRQVVQPSNQPPVFAILITDGDHNLEEDEAEKQFKYASFQNIFIKSFGLTGGLTGEKAHEDKFEFLKNMEELRSSEKEKEEHKSAEDIGFSLFNCCFQKSSQPKMVAAAPRFLLDNHHFLEVGDPAGITIRDLIHQFRGWLEDAHIHKIYTQMPNISVKIEDDEGRVKLKK